LVPYGSLPSSPAGSVWFFARFGSSRLPAQHFRFTPSCHHHTYTAHTHGLPFGSCNPYTPHGCGLPLLVLTFRVGSRIAFGSRLRTLRLHRCLRVTVVLPRHPHVLRLLPVAVWVCCRFHRCRTFCYGSSARCLPYRATHVYTFTVLVLRTHTVPGWVHSLVWFLRFTGCYLTVAFTRRPHAAFWLLLGSAYTHYTFFAGSQPAHLWFGLLRYLVVAALFARGYWFTYTCRCCATLVYTRWFVHILPPAFWILVYAHLHTVYGYTAFVTAVYTFTLPLPTVCTRATRCCLLRLPLYPHATYLCWFAFGSYTAIRWFTHVPLHTACLLRTLHLGCYTYRAHTRLFYTRSTPHLRTGYAFTPRALCLRLPCCYCTTLPFTFTPFTHTFAVPVCRATVLTVHTTRVYVLTHALLLLLRLHACGYCIWFNTFAHVLPHTGLPYTHIYVGLRLQLVTVGSLHGWFSLRGWFGLIYAYTQRTHVTFYVWVCYTRTLRLVWVTPRSHTRLRFTTRLV